MADMIHERLFTLLRALVGDRVYPNVATESVVAPFIVYTEIPTPSEVTLDGNEPITNTRMQIDCYDVGFTALQNLVLQVKTAMRSWDVQNVPLFKQNGYDRDTKLYRVTLDFSIWHND